MMVINLGGVTCAELSTIMVMVTSRIDLDPMFYWIRSAHDELPSYDVILLAIRSTIRKACVGRRGSGVCGTLPTYCACSSTSSPRSA